MRVTHCVMVPVRHPMRSATQNNGHEPAAPTPPEPAENAELAAAEVALFERWVVAEKERLQREAAYVNNSL